MSAAEKEYYENLERQRKDTDDFYLDLIESVEKSSQGFERLNSASDDWDRKDLAAWPEVQTYGKEVAAQLAASREANDSSSSFVTGEVINGNFRRADSTMVSQETLIAKSVRLGEREWQQFSGGSDDVRDEIARQHAGDAYQEGLSNAVALNPPLSAAGQQPFVVIPGKDGQIESISLSAQKSALTPEKKTEFADHMRQLNERYGDSEFKNGVYLQPEGQPPSVKQSGQPESGDAPGQSNANGSYSSPAPNYGHAGGSGWGGDKIADHWNIHERKQQDLKVKIDSAAARLEEARLKGVDVSGNEATLKFAQNNYAMSEHEQAARSWSNAAGYARVSHIGGMADSESALKASRMADYHRYQVEMLREQQMEIKNPEIAAQRAQEAAQLQSKIDEQQRYFREIAESNRKIQEEHGGPTTQDKIDSLDRFLSGQDPKPEQPKAQQPEQPQAIDQKQPQVAEKVKSEIQAQQPEAPAQQQAEVKSVDANADTGTADPTTEDQVQVKAEQVKPDAEVQQPEQPKVAEQAQPEPQAQQPEAPAQQQAELKQVDANADTGTADPVAEDQAQQQTQTKVEQVKPDVEVQQPEQPQVAEQSQPEPQAQQPEAPAQQQAEVKSVDANADTGTADTTTEDQVQVKAEQVKPEAEVQQPEQPQVAEQAQPEPQAQQVEAPAQQQAEAKSVDAQGDTGTADKPAEDQTQQLSKQPEAKVQQAEKAEQVEAQQQTSKQPEQAQLAEQQANQAEHKSAVENAQGLSTARAQETGQAPQQVSAAPTNSGDQVKGNEVQQMSQDQASQQASQPAAQENGHDPHQRVRDMEAKGQAQIDQEKSKGTYAANDQANMNSLNEQGAQAKQASAEMAQTQEQNQGKSMSM